MATMHQGDRPRTGPEGFYDDAEVAARYESRALTKRNRYKLEERVHYLLKWGRVGRDSMVLSIGAGTGMYEEHIKSDKLICLDLAREMLKRAVTKGLSCVQGSALCLPFPDESFDCVAAIGLSTLHYDDAMRRSSIAEMSRVTRKGGRVVTMTRNKLQRTLLSLSLLRNPHHDAYKVAPSDIERGFRDHGLEVEKSISIQYPRFYSPRLNAWLGRLRLDLLGAWFICCGVKR